MSPRPAGAAPGRATPPRERPRKRRGANQRPAVRLARPGVLPYPQPMPPITAERAEDLLDGRPLVAAMAGSIPEMKALRERCLLVGIPAVVGCPPGSGKG